VWVPPAAAAVAAMASAATAIAVIADSAKRVLCMY
jgi:hypothetical protein